MDYDTFEQKLLSKIERKVKCMKLINENEKLIIDNLSNYKSSIVKKFVEKINNIIIVSSNFKIIDKVLRHSLFNTVLRKFRESDVLVQACKNINKNAIKWLLTMDINPNIQDKNGMTAIMHAAEHYQLKETVKSLLDTSSLDIEDNDGNTALFHSIKNKDIFDLIIEKKPSLDHVNRDNDTIFIHCCKHGKFKTFIRAVIYGKEYNMNVCTDSTQIAIKYLVENGKYMELMFIKRYIPKINFNYIFENGETLVSILIPKLYEAEKKLTIDLPNYFHTLKFLIDAECNFNVPIDGDGNTALMFFLMIKDYVSAYTLLEFCKDLDYSICNKYGISANYLGSLLRKEDFDFYVKMKNHLFIRLDFEIFKEMFYKNDTFKFIKPDGRIVISPYQIPDHLATVEQTLSTAYFEKYVDKKGDKYIEYFCYTMDAIEILNSLSDILQVLGDINLC